MRALTANQYVAGDPRSNKTTSGWYDLTTWGYNPNKCTITVKNGCLKIVHKPDTGMTVVYGPGFWRYVGDA